MKCRSWTVDFMNHSGNSQNNMVYIKTIAYAFYEKSTKLYPVSETRARDILKNFKDSHKHLTFVSKLHRCDGNVTVDLDVENGDWDDSYPYPTLEIKYKCSKCSSTHYPELPRNIESLQKFIQKVMDGGIDGRKKGYIR